MTLPRIVGPLLLWSTSPLPAPSLAIEVVRRSLPGRECLSLVVLQTPLDHSSPDEVTTLHQQFSGHGIDIDAVDPGLQDRADACRVEVVTAIRDADLILVTGGNPDRMVEVVRETPALDALRDASRRGALVGGGSAGAMVFGQGLLVGSPEDRRPFPLLGWLANIVIAPHFGNYPIEPWRVAFPRSIILGLPDGAVTLVTDGGTRFASAGERAFTILLPAGDPTSVAPGDAWTHPGAIR